MNFPLLCGFFERRGQCIHQTLVLLLEKLNPIRVVAKRHEMGLLHEDEKEVLLIANYFEMSLDERVESVAQRSVSGPFVSKDGVNEGLEFPNDVVEHGEEEFFLSLFEIIVERAFSELCTVGNFVQCGISVAPFGEYGARGVEHRIASHAPLPLTAGQGRVGGICHGEVVDAWSECD